MSGWIETYRGWVWPWECDPLDHFTIAYYFDRYAHANLGLMTTLGLAAMADDKGRRGFGAVECYCRFFRELRTGDVFHIESGVISCAEKVFTKGHKVLESVSGETAATMQQTTVYFDLDARRALPIPAPARAIMEAARVDWDGPEIERRTEPRAAAAFFPSARRGVSAWEIDLMGHWNFQFYVQAFTLASAQAQAAFGMTPAYCRAEKRGLSTFELDLKFVRELRSGDYAVVESAIAEVGRSSFRLFHRMRNGRSGELAATMSQFGVHFDTAARRPAALPPELKARAEALAARAAEPA